MESILTVMAPLFLIIFLSACWQKYKPLGAEWSRVLNGLALNVGLPVLIFTALAKNSVSLSQEAGLILANSGFILASMLLIFLLGKAFRLNKKSLKTWLLCGIFGNVAYLGIPVLSQISGEQILPTASLIVAIYLFWIFTVAVGILNYKINENKTYIIKETFKNCVKNPLLLAVVLGLLTSGFQITLPQVLITTLDMISALATPTVLIILGLFIGNSKIGKISEWGPVLAFTILTLALLPAAFYGSFLAFGYNPTLFSSSIIQAAMPLAITPFAMADQYELDKAFIARCVVLSTIISVISLPLWIVLTR